MEKRIDNSQLIPFGKRKPSIRFLSASLTFCFVLIGLATSSSAATYYIDFQNGLNSNPGTKTLPWRSHPYMQTAPDCTEAGLAPTYIHAPGDQFNFKGGVTWPRICFPLVVANGGASNSERDYYGVDQTWFVGKSWARPVFDLAGEVFSVPAINTMYKSNLTFDNLEVKNAKFVSNSWPNGVGGFGAYFSENITWQNLYIHDWDCESGCTIDSCGGGIGGGGPATNQVIDNCVIAGNSNWGCAARDVTEVKNSTLHDAPNLSLGVGSTHDNHIYNVRNSGDPDSHENGIECMSQGCWIYNNVIHDTYAVSVSMNHCWGGRTPGVGFFFNNVVWNGPPIHFDDNNQDMTDCPLYICNNTFQANGGIYYVRVGRSGTWGTVVVENNQYINVAGNSDALHVEATINNLLNRNNISQTLSDATTQGYVLGNYFAPASRSNITVNAGLDASTYFSLAGVSPVDRNNVARPQGTTWDIGAYEYVPGGDTMPPAAPKGLAVK